MAFSELDRQRIKNNVGGLCSKRTPTHLKDQLQSNTGRGAGPLSSSMVRMKFSVKTKQLLTIVNKPRRDFLSMDVLKEEIESL